MGQTYHQGYLGGFGIDESMFIEATDRTLLSGFYALVNIGIKPIIYSAAASVALVFIAIISAILFSSERAENLKATILTRAQAFRSHTPISPKMVELVDLSTKIYTYTAAIFTIFILTLVLFLFSSKSGNEQAEKEKISFKKSSANTSMVYSSALQAPTNAKLIACGAIHCAFWLGGSAIVIKIDQVDKIIITPATDATATKK